MKRKNRIFFFSPHFDDVIFSAGGTVVNHLNNNDDVFVVTVFSAIPSLNNVSKFSLSIIHPNLVKKRVKENFIILNNIGAKIINLDFFDAIFRKDVNGQDLYLSWGDIFIKNEDIHFKESNLYFFVKEKIFSFIDKSENSIFYFPLSLGGHIDHVILNKIAKEACNKFKNLNIYYYEDLPYADNFSSKDAFFNDYVVKKIEDIDVDYKISLVSKYKEGLAIGAGASAVISHIKNHASRIGKKGKNFERFWTYCNK